ncbi:MAG: TetR/AcrR family transcriptional regulator [Novosphingobium sp.]|nr:TetR/AcrR family transcriptional regulator [Novosphingobium sp.]
MTLPAAAATDGGAAKPHGRKVQILDEAIRLLGEHGFNGATVQALARRCGITNAGLLYYFGSKDALLLEVLDEYETRERRVITPLVKAIEAARADADTTWGAILAMMRGIVARFVERPDLARFLFVVQAEALDRTHPAHQWFRERDARTIELFASVLEGFVVDPESTARRALSGMQGLAQHWLRQEASFDLAAEWDALAALVIVRDTR